MLSGLFKRIQHYIIIILNYCTLYQKNPAHHCILLRRVPSEPRSCYRVECSSITTTPSQCDKPSFPEWQVNFVGRTLFYFCRICGNNEINNLEEFVENLIKNARGRNFNKTTNGEQRESSVYMIGSRGATVFYILKKFNTEFFNFLRYKDHKFKRRGSKANRLRAGKINSRFTKLAGKSFIYKWNAHYKLVLLNN